MDFQSLSMILLKEDRKRIRTFSTRERRKALAGQICELCGIHPARNILDNSLLLCCCSHPLFCSAVPNDRSVCWFCGRPAIKKARCGFVCGTNRKRGCQAWAEEVAKKTIETKGKIPDFEIHRLSRFKETCLKKYGVENPIQSKELRDKQTQITRERFGMTPGELLRRRGEEYCHKNGVTNTWQIPSVREKILHTNMERYGVLHAAQAVVFKEKTKISNMTKYGVEYAMKLPTTIQKRNKTNLERYGYSEAMSNPEMYKKALVKRYRIKNFVLPSGRVVNCQGYENRAIKFHLRHFREEDMLFNGELQIAYTKSDGTKGLYRPDLADKASHTLIEVKSLWTLKQEKYLLEKLLAAASLGWEPFVEIWAETGDCPVSVMGLIDIQTLRQVQNDNGIACS